MISDFEESLFSQYLLKKKSLHYTKQSLEAMEKDIKATEMILKAIKDSSSKTEYKVFYDHYVKGLSISLMAKKYSYSTSGIKKILRNIQKKANKSVTKK